MKKIAIIIFLTLSFLLLTNCNKEEKKEEVKNEKIKFSDDTYKLFEEFTENKKDTIKKLKTLNKEEADKLYEQYSEDNENILYKIGQKSEKFLDSIYYGSVEEQFTEKDWNDTNKFLNKYDLELWDIGEGMVIIREIPHFYYDIFKGYVTDDYSEYLKIVARENEDLYQADAGLSISFEEIGERIVTWENFLNKFPNSTLKPKVTTLLNSYREDYILGMENTPTRDGGYNGQPYIIYEENMKEFNRFIKKYPNSPTVELIKYFLENYQNENIYKLVHGKIIEKFGTNGIVDVVSKNLGKMMAIERNLKKYVLKDKDWSLNLQYGCIFSEEEKYSIYIIGTSVLKEDGSSTWTWAWENSNIFNEILLSLVNTIREIDWEEDLNILTTLSNETNVNILLTAVSAILDRDLAFYHIDYTEIGGTVYFAIDYLPDEVFSPVDAITFMDIIKTCIKSYTLNHKLFVESFLKWNKNKYEWQGNTIIVDFGKDEELKIDFEKIEDKLVLKEINLNEVK